MMSPVSARYGGSHGRVADLRHDSKALKNKMSHGGRSEFPEFAKRIKARKELRVALCVPIGGIAGIWGPSALASAKLAISELNQLSGIAGYLVKLVLVNATDDDRSIETRLCELMEFNEIDALVGMHTSSVRQRVTSVVAGRVPFVYSPMYEGGERTPGVFAIGETTEQQLRPAIDWMGRHQHARRWVLVGNDYVYPRVTHRLAKRYIKDSGGSVLAEYYRPFGTTDFSSVIEQLRKHRADAVLLSLVGQDQVEFNRSFGEAGLSSSVARLTCTILENELLAIGAENTDNLLVTAGYFGSLNSDANMMFKERYHGLFGERAPTLNAFGESAYEGIHFLAALIESGALGPLSRARKSGAIPGYRSARATSRYARNSTDHAPIYMARADGLRFSVLARF